MENILKFGGMVMWLLDDFVAVKGYMKELIFDGEFENNRWWMICSVIVQDRDD